ncbi:hypothetical protein CCMSSC00406_0010188 [Pleurotus cornucopiae]|uniref:Uncharacterized protein n=1 Tax=Pleurotus cornucopiae TaxID=5321 RepID=A0ACB7INQ5_PLECO|nr:hypothetical protein CCMSSC00406_0010188 [Pleurotus cornucopiae]
MGQYFKFINLDKYQTAGSGKFGEFDGHCAALLLATRPPLITLEKAFKDIFSYDVPDVADPAALGQLGQLPVELIAQIFAPLSIKEALVFGLTHGHLFVIGWQTIKKKISHVVFIDDWSNCRIICLGDYASTLPEGYLSDEEKFSLMKRAIKRDRDHEADEDDGDVSDESAGEDHDGNSLSLRLAAFKDQTFGLYDDSQLMCSERDIKSWRSSHSSVADLYRRRITRLEMGRVATVSHVLGFYRYGPWHSEPLRFADSVLVNNTKREYVRAVDAAGRYVFDDAIPLLTVWEDRMHGDWAGDRLALPSAEEFEKILAAEEGWTEKVAEWVLNP